MAGESSFSRTYGPLLTTTWEKLLMSGVVHDNVYNANPTLDWLYSGNRIKKIDGGERIRIPLMTSGNGTFKWYSDYENLNITPQVGQTTAWYTWKQGAISVSINGKEMRSNKGAARIADLTKEKRSQAELSMMDSLATGVFSDGTGTAGKQITGLEAALEASFTGSYAEIDASVNTNWQNQVTASVGAAAVNLVPKLRNIMNSCSEGKDGAASAPDAIIMPQTVHESFEALVEPRQRFTPGQDAKLGIDKLTYKGAQVWWDSFCTAQTVYVLNSNHICLFVHNDADMSMTDEGFQKPIDQDALVAQILFQGNIAVNNRRKLGKLTGVT